MPRREDQQSAARDSPAPRNGLRLMAVILIAFALLSIFSNYQKANISRIEQVTVAPAPPPIPPPAPSLSPVPGEP
jgi:hypothetical protein